MLIKWYRDLIKKQGHFLVNLYINDTRELIRAVRTACAPDREPRRGASTPRRVASSPGPCMHSYRYIRIRILLFIIIITGTLNAPLPHCQLIVRCVAIAYSHVHRRVTAPRATLYFTCPAFLVCRRFSWPRLELQPAPQIPSDR